MSIFEDKHYEEMDWLSQAVEPVNSNLQNILNEMPDIITIDYNILSSYIKSNNSTYVQISKKNLIQHAMHSLNNSLYNKLCGLSWDIMDAISRSYNMESANNFTLNIEEKTLSNNIVITKIENQLSDDLIKRNWGQSAISNTGYSINNWDYKRANEIFRILEGSKTCSLEKALKTKSSYKKKRFLVNRLREIFKDDSWYIKNEELCNKLCKWITYYINTGNTGAMANIYKLKVMTYNKVGIYSIQEVAC